MHRLTLFCWALPCQNESHCHWSQACDHAKTSGHANVARVGIALFLAPSHAWASALENGHDHVGHGHGVSHGCGCGFDCDGGLDHESDCGVDHDNRAQNARYVHIRSTSPRASTYEDEIFHISPCALATCGRPNLSRHLLRLVVAQIARIQNRVGCVRANRCSRGEIQ